jgi:hypothetical protein
VATDPVELAFRQLPRCSKCDEAMDPGTNWGCLNIVLPIEGAPGAFTLVHDHLHFRCATGPVRKYLVDRAQMYAQTQNPFRNTGQGVN